MKKISDSLPKITFQRKQQLQLVNLAGDLAEQTREEAGTLGFMSRLLIMVNLPYRDPGKDTINWYRQNGNVTINVVPGFEGKRNIGIPYGSFPRLILAYLITQAIKTQDSIIYLGESFADFLRIVNIRKGGTTYKRLYKQLERTLSASFAWTYRDKEEWSRTNIQISSKSQVWWNSETANQKSLWKSQVKLNTDFFNEIMRNAIPFDLRVLGIFKNSPLGLDLYMFISWRIFNLKSPTYISWKSLQEQLGGQYAEIKVFARDCRIHIKRIQAICPNLNIQLLRGRIYIAPSPNIHNAVNYKGIK